MTGGYGKEKIEYPADTFISDGGIMKTTLFLPVALILLTMIILQTPAMALAYSTGKLSTSNGVKVEFIIASWVGPITDVRFNILTPQFWWDLGNELVYEKLAVFVRKNNSFIPWLAESWEWKDDTTFVIHLRKGVRWNDGEPFTSKDVWTQMIIIKAWGWTEYRDIVSVETPDDYTVVVHVKPGTFKLLEEYFLLYSFPMALPYHIFGVYAEKIEQGFKIGNRTLIDDTLGKIYSYKFQKPIGTGPYILTNRTSAEAVFVKNPSYWNPKAQVVDVIRVIRAQDNPHMWTYYQGGTVDSGDAVMPAQVEEAVLSKPWSKVVKVPDSGVALYFNINSTYLSDVRVRRAIAYIIDRQQVLSSWSNVYTPVKIPDGLHDWMRNQWLDQATINMLNTYERNLDKARQLLEAAGFTYDENTKKWYTPNGTVFTLRFYAPSGWTDWNTIGQAIAKQLQDFGIQVDYRAVEDSTLWGQIWPGKQFDLILNWWGAWNLLHPWVCHWQWINRFESIGLPTTFETPGFGTLNASALWRQLQSNSMTVAKNATRLLSLIVNYDLPILPLGEKRIPVFVNTREGTNSPYRFEWPDSSDPIWYSASISRFETTLVLLWLHHAKVIILGQTTTTQTTTTTTTTTQQATTTTSEHTTMTQTTTTQTTRSSTPETTVQQGSEALLLGVAVVIILAVAAAGYFLLRKKS